MSGFTMVPRWTQDPVHGTGEHELMIPEQLRAELHRVANDTSVSLRSVLLAAHAKVLGALSGDGELWTGLAGACGAPVPCHVTLGAPTWRGLILDAARAEAESLGDQDDSGDDADDILGPRGFLPEAVLEFGAGSGELPHGTVLRVAMLDDQALVIRFRYRTEVLDAACAARIAGYHLSVLTRIAADPDVEHARASLVPVDEQHLQLDGFAGPRRELPDALVHQLFETWVRTQPDAVAVVQGERHLTYRALNERANQLARALMVRGVAREDVIAVVTERNLDWIAAVLAVFKAGAAYLPVEPRFPADRIRSMLARAGCRLAVTEPGSSATLDDALRSLPGVGTLLVDTALQEGHAGDDLGVAIAPGQLAYIFFTSGSTGEPKGAMCEHAGMLNHILAKIEDLGIREGHVVAQVAPQCFDISVWQLLAGLLSGGRTLIVEQEVILDAARFLDTIVEERANVLQVVPSYLDVLVSTLASRPRPLPDLRVVLATGEALKRELVQRWFDVQPGIRLVNAYGLTETSDDTNHEIMERAPDGERVPLGKPINNVAIYVVDEQLSLVPLGAPGEIVFSGVCVGRGYINDPERTQRAFLADPHRAGERLYRSGDYGRWRPDGKLEFLGRRDAQVKINGFRVEIGEIENRLLGLPGVREGAVVAIERADRSKQLVAFYSAERPLDASTMRNRLGESLPSYMVPAVIHWRDRLPVTDNGKIDKKALGLLAGLLESAEEGREAPRTPAERRLASLWAGILGIPTEQIGRSDHFFELGGTSLSALRLAIAVERALSFKDIAEHPMLSDQAAFAEARGALTGIASLAPVLDGAAGCMAGLTEATA